MRLLIKNGRVIDPASGKDDTLDILIDKGKILDIKPSIKDDSAKLLDVSRKVVAPGFIDMHVHLREPGFEYKETISSGTAAAARGGITTVCCMPNTNPVNDSRGVTESIISEAKKHGIVNVLPIAAVSRNLAGKELTEMADLAEAGAVAFSDDGHPINNSLLMRRALEYSRINDYLIIDHCEDKDLSDQGVMNEGQYSVLLGLRGMPAEAEEIMVSRDILLAEKIRARIHIAHVSTAGSVARIREAKKRNIRITAEVTPHHLLLTDEAVQSFDTNLKVNPPLRSREDVKALTEAVRDGIIDVIATDHAPHAPDEKDMEFDYAPFGINGLETAVSLLLNHLVHGGIIPLEKFISMFSTHPARILGLEDKGKLCIGADADITILDLNRKTVVNPSKFASLSRNTPFGGQSLKGLPEITIVAGKIVHRY